ncbi:DUF4153 domain-containing protein [Tenacibaculum sp. IB213877]|uniref:DUF4153 domain-containing protein n=1 Tax=Tenacibaculum sp. IB213877 TaxID=3097351 RepID=UPI002A5A2A3B|nr:DUF4153 domain-containing protein [Tenacibaculum sp. IB213877]MDY0780599.1 DUF4153 domain-containing protein [Tenacibaculum sp. IB213877]
MKLIPSFGEITQRSKEALQRFPITLAWAVIGTLYTLITIESKTFDNTFSGKVILTFILGISWLIATRFFEEQFKKDKEWIFLLTLTFLFIFFSTLTTTKDMNNVNITRFILFFLAGHLLVFVSPFIFKYDKNAYFNYLKTIFTAIVRSLFFSLILYLGIILALLAIRHLFNVYFDGKRYFQVFVVCMGIVNTWIYLSDFPKEIHNQTTIHYTKALEVLVKYILIPLVILYLIILYAYSLKIVINWSLPKGWVSYLVTALAFLGFVIQLLVNPVEKTINSRAIRRFHPWFYILLLPLLVLLFVAIFRRISEYGITENRYFVAVLACYVLAMTLYMLISKHKQTRFFMLILAGLMMLVSFGFWGAFSVATKSQVKEFTKVYNDIKSTNFTTTHKKKNRLRSIIQYLNDKNDIDKLEPIIGYNPKHTFKEVTWWSLTSKLMDSLNINVENESRLAEEIRYYNLDEINAIIHIKNYDYLKRMHFNHFNDKRNSINDYTFSLKKNSKLILVSKNENEVGFIDCTQLVDSLKKQERTNAVNEEVMTVTTAFKNVDIKIIFKDVSLEKENNKEHIYSGSAYVLIKEHD